MDQLTVASELRLLGRRKVAGYEFTGIEGGFGEGKKAMLVLDIATIHNQPLKEINRRINDNRIRFKDGVDIVDLKSGGFNPPQLLNLGFSNMQIAKSNNIYLLSERGYAKLLKILEDDKAWELYDILVDEYFNMREKNQVATDPMSILKLTFEALEGQQQAIEEIKSDVQDLRENTPLFAIECDEISTAVKRQGVILLGGKQSNAYRNRGLRGKVYRDIYNQLYREFGVKSHKAIKRCHLNVAVKIVEEYTLPIVLSEEISFVNAQMDFTEM
ncbi:putative antirepressor [Bacillus phage Gamma isolate d'Herelle]|uniref:Antirepressor n=3 Tax=Wbetavirus TaxID=1623308 RepID=Q2LIF3_9CAUD|nr:ORF6C domain-containing protein [Bacillus anthracis]YP_010739526.1 antirepressor, putative [Bacillus phage Gamma]YP_338160.1 transcriptional regulator, putative [Bacillus phage Cherry]YP_338213.1 anti-repressor [Bacillus phage Gamma]YP_459996.1 anti-repressor [Bacillus phage WBeta]YP_512341.1 anti-repressor [Bacillus phage Fah]ABC40483.1 putative antirepressor [Bacillus phage Gamma isolate d'Herelle]EDX57948.1 putative antirepressor [Bacillus cereus W]ABA42723.1 antirepressor [Bacillus p